MKYHALFALLFLFSSFAYASQLNVMVSVTQGTLAVGTNVSIVTGGVELASKKADLSGVASFNVSDGSYFVLLRRYPYPLHVSLVEVKGTTNISLSMRQLISYANAYGQITGPASFANSSVAAYSGSDVAKRVYPNKDGYYVLSYVPEGNYRLSFKSPGYQEGQVEVFLPTADFIQVDARLEKVPAPLEQLPALAVPATVAQFSTIEVSLTNGTSPLAGQAISADTPSGKLKLVTDSAGIARLNAPAAGTYTFAWGNLSYSTKVNAAQQPPVKENITPPAVVPKDEPPQQPPEKNDGGLLAVIVVAVAIGAIMLIAAVLLALNYFSKAKKHDHGAPGHEHHAHGQHGHAKGSLEHQPGHGEGSEEHKHHEHSHKKKE